MRAAEDVDPRRSCRRRDLAPRDRGELGDQRVRGALGRVAVPQRDRARRGRAAGDARRSARADGSSPSRTFVPWRDRDRPLGVRAQRVAGDAERGRLLLHAAGVGDDRARAGLRATGSRGSRPGRCSARPRASSRLERRCRASRARVRGWTGKTTGARRAERGQRVDDRRRGWRGSSTFDGRWSVTST